MFSAFLSGYREAGGKPAPVVIGMGIGLVGRTAAQTVVVVVVLRLMGVL